MRFSQPSLSYLQPLPHFRGSEQEAVFTTAGCQLLSDWNVTPPTIIQLTDFELFIAFLTTFAPLTLNKTMVATQDILYSFQNKTTQTWIKEKCGGTLEMIFTKRVKYCSY